MNGELSSTPEEGQHQLTAPPEPTTVKKRHVFGRSNGRGMEPLRINAMLPELNNLLDTAKKERRSHGTAFNRKESCEWMQSNFTIPETASYGKEWNVPEIGGSHALSQADLRNVRDVQVSEATPIKSHSNFLFKNSVSTTSEKENFFTPHKPSDTPMGKAPARCPLSAIPMVFEPMKETQEHSGATLSSQPPNEAHKIIDVDKNLNGALKEGNHHAGVFRTSSFKVNQKIVPPSRQRLFAVSSNSVPLHPAVAASQSQQRQNQYQPSHAPCESAVSRKMSENTPLKAAPSSMGALSGLTPFQSTPVPIYRKAPQSETPGGRPLAFGSSLSQSQENNVVSKDMLPPSGYPQGHIKSSKDPPMLLNAEPLPQPNRDPKHTPQQLAYRRTLEPHKETTSKSELPIERAKAIETDPNHVQPPVQAHSAQNISTRQVVVNGKSYTILSLLGRGGSSKVFQVIDPETSELKAVKCVNLAETDQSICEGYLNEIKLLADLQDGDCVIRMFDHEHQQQNKMLFVVMEKGDTDLSKLIKEVSKSKKISPAMIVYYWTEMLNAVSFIHKRGTIHSDLKPANFLLVSGRLKLIDFGIASSVQEDMTSVVKDNMTGTYNYISPESLSSTSPEGQSYKISYKSDVWSLGCILYNLVYGRTPFQHITNQFQKLSAIVSSAHKIAFPQPPIDGCPPALVQAMKACLVRNPKERASVDELLQLSYLGQSGPEGAILSKVANLVASVGLNQESDGNSAASVVRAIQRLIIDNEKDLPFLRVSH